MKKQSLHHIALMSLVILTGFLTPRISVAQERIAAETPDVEEKRERMAWSEYNQDVNSRFEKIMAEVDRMKKQMAEKKTDNPRFRKALSKFEKRANALRERMKNANNIAAKNQAAYRKKMRSELHKLNQDYNKLVDRWK